MASLNLSLYETPTYALTVIEDDDLLITLNGSMGPTGPAGPTGPTGPAGVGVPVGGAAGQALTKIDATDYNTQWSDVQAVGGPLLVAVKNNGAAALTKGEVVYFTGANGENILIGRAQANSEPLSSKTIGFTNAAFTINGQGYVITEGYLTGLTIPHQSCAVGDPIWLSPTTAGGVVFGLTNKPSSPNHLVYLGVVKKIAGPNVTEIYVKVQNGFELQELHNVTISASGNALAVGDVLSCYDSTSNHGYWRNEHTSITGTAGSVVRYDSAGGIFGNSLSVNGVTISDPLANTSGRIAFAGDAIVLDGDLAYIKGTFSVTSYLYSISDYESAVAGIVFVGPNTSLSNSSANWSIIYSGAASFSSLTLASALSISNGGTGGTTASAARTNLGAGTVGSSLFQASTVADARSAIQIVKYEVSSSTSATSVTAVDISGLTGITFDANSVYKVEWQFDGSCSTTTGLVSVLNVPSISTTVTSPATFGLVNKLSGGFTNAYFLSSTTISLRGEDTGAAQTTKATGGSLIFKTGSTGGTGKVTVANSAAGTGTATISRGVVIITKL